MKKYLILLNTILLFFGLLYFQNSFARSYKFSISCSDLESGCELGFDYKKSTDWNYTHINGTTVSLRSAGTYEFKISDNRGNYTTKSITLTNSNNNGFNISEGNTVEKVLNSNIGGNSKTQALDKNGNFIDDEVQCFGSSSITYYNHATLQWVTEAVSCGDIISPNGNVLFNDIGGIEAIGLDNKKRYQTELLCTKSDLTIKANCINDPQNPSNSNDPISGCNGGVQETKNISLNQIGDFGIVDNIGNLTILNYKIDNIDRFIPQYNDGNYNGVNSEELKGSLLVANGGLAGNNNVSFSLYDEYPTMCNSLNKISYNIYITGPDGEKIFSGDTSSNTSKTIKNTINNDGIGTYYAKYNITKDLNITKSGNYHISKIVFSDIAGNSNLKTFLSNDSSSNFTVYPSDLDENNTTLTLLNPGTKYANNEDYYEYLLNLKDSHGNPIVNKELYSIEQSTSNTILTDSDISGNKAIIENFSGLSDSNGSMKFKIKSLAPGDFVQNFGIKLKKWGTNNIDLSTGVFEINKEIQGNNEFFKPFTSELVIYTTGGIDYPKVGTTQ